MLKVTQVTLKPTIAQGHPRKSHMIMSLLSLWKIFRTQVVLLISYLLNTLRRNNILL